MTEEQKQIVYPLNFTECPNCGSARTIAKDVLEQEKAKGKIGEHSTAFLFRHQSIITEPLRNALTAPSILSYFDACADCGTVICAHTEVKNTMLTTKFPGRGGR